MVKRTVESELRANVGNYTTGMEKAKAATEGLADSQAKASESTDKLGGKALSQTDSWRTVSTGLIGAGAAAAAFGIALPTKSAADFEAAMAQVSATGPEAKQRLSDLAVAARESATDIDGAGYSAVQAAGGIEALIKAGVGVDDVMGGAMQGSLALAAAGQMGVAEAAEAAATAMTQFKLEGKDVPHIADLLAAGAGKAQGDVSDFTMALSQSGLVASQFGLSIEDTVGTLTAFASAGLLGSDAGTSFRNMLLRLADPAGEAGDLLKDLGINAYDAQGEFVGIVDLSGQLQAKLGGLTDQQRQATLAQVFGTDAIRAASIMYEQGAAGMQDWIDQTNDAGYAQEVASERLNSLNGDLQKLWGVLGEVSIAAGEANSGPLRGLVQTITDLLRAASENPEVLQTVAIGIGAIGVAAAAFGITMKIVTAVVEFRDAVAKLGTTAKTATPDIDGAEKASGRLSKTLGAAGRIAAAGGILIFLGNLRNALLATKTGSEEAETAMLRFVEGTGDLDKVFTRTDGTGIWESARGGVNDLESALQALSDGTPKWTGRYKAVAEQFDLIDQSLTNMDPEQAGVAFSRLRDSADELGIPLDVLLGQLDGYVAKADAAAAANGSGELSFQQLMAILSAGIPVVEETATVTDDAATQTQRLREAQQASAAAAEAQAQAVADSLTSINDYYTSVLGASDANIALEASFDAATESAEKHGATLDLDTDAGRANQSALNDIVKAAYSNAEAMTAAGNSTEEVTASTQRARDSFIVAAQQMGLNEEQAGTLADELGLIPEDVTTRVSQPGMSGAQTDTDDLYKLLDKLPPEVRSQIKITVDKSGYWDANNTLNSISGRTVTTYVAIKKTGNGMLATGGYGADVAAAIGLKDGGQAYRRYSGLVEGPGTPTSDSIHAMISRKEFVVNAAATDYYTPTAMYMINSRAIPRENLHAVLGLRDGGSPAYATPARLAMAPAGAAAVHQHTHNLTVPRDAFRDINAFMGFVADIEHLAEAQ